MTKRRCLLIALLLLTALLLVGCKGKIDKEAIADIERIGIAPIDTQAYIKITESAEPNTLINFDPKIEGQAILGLVEDDQMLLGEEIYMAGTVQPVRLLKYADSDPFAEPLEDASRRHMKDLAPLVDELDLDGILWIERSYWIYVLPGFLRGDSNYWYGMVTSQARLLDPTGDEVLKAKWTNYGEGYDRSKEPTPDQALAALNEAYTHADTDAAKLITKASTAKKIPDLGNPAPKIKNKLVYQIAMFVRGLIVLGALILGGNFILGALGGEHHGCLALIGLVLAAGAIYLIIWQLWWHDMFIALDLATDLVGG